jgi:hypothetical protein
LRTLPTPVAGGLRGDQAAAAVAADADRRAPPDRGILHGMTSPSPAGRELSRAAAAGHFDGGGFEADLARRVAYRTESQDPASGTVLQAYLADELLPPSRPWASRARYGPTPWRAPARC